MEIMQKEQEKQKEKKNDNKYLKLIKAKCDKSKAEQMAPASSGTAETFRAPTGGATVATTSGRDSPLTLDDEDSPSSNSAGRKLDIKPSVKSVLDLLQEQVWSFLNGNDDDSYAKRASTSELEAEKLRTLIARTKYYELKVRMLVRDEAEKSRKKRRVESDSSSDSSSESE